MGLIRWLGVEEFVVRPHVDAWPQFEAAGLASAPHLKRLAIVDTETLGLADNAPTIEVAVRQVAYDPRDGTLLGVVEEYAALQDPGVPVPAEITALTGITDADVKGQAIDRAKVAGIIGGSAIVVSHNAAFDRPRVDAIGGTKVPWACTSNMIDWRGLGLPAAALGALCLSHGFYASDAHRAMADVRLLHRLLTTANAETGKTYFAMLLAEARKPVDEVFAAGSHFSTKDTLKGRGYRWQQTPKVWTRVLPRAESPAELDWLRSTGISRKPFAKPIDPYTRFARA